MYGWRSPLLQTSITTGVLTAEVKSPELTRPLVNASAVKYWLDDEMAEPDVV